MAKRDPQYRDQNAAELMTGALEGVELTGAALEVGGLPAVTFALQQTGLKVSRWTRYAGSGVTATAEPPQGPFERIALRLPKSKDALVMQLHQLGARLAEGGHLWLYGANDEGIKSVGKVALDVFDEVETVDARRHCRLYQCSSPRGGLKARFEDWVTEHELDGLSWKSAPGVFAHGHVDPGTQLLLDHLPEELRDLEALDFACGIGRIGMALQARGCTVTQSDNDAVALALAELNVPGATSILADGLPQGRKFEAIVSNPPYHTGKAQEFGVIEGLVKRAPAILVRGGHLVMVTPRTLPLHDALRDAGFRKQAVLKEQGNYRVWWAVL